MKKIFTLALTLMLFSYGFTQSVPQGMKYQAVARDAKGQVLANQKISLKISLVNDNPSPVAYYSELHEIKTNELGLFTLVIGEGSAKTGAFKDVPWSTQDIWMQVSIKDAGASAFTTISNSKLLAVPYAFHAATASQLVRSNAANGNKVDDGVPSAVWSLKGNLRSDPATDKLGTTDFVDLVMITNNIERLRVTANGDVIFKNNSEIGNDLTVKQNVRLNTVGGTTIINGPTTVDKMSPTVLTGTLRVNNDATLKKKVMVDTTLTSTSPTTGALVVKGGVGIGGNLNVAGAVALDSTIIVKGRAILNNSLDVAGNAYLKGALTTDGVETITNKTVSNSPTTGALVVAGGVGIGGDLNVTGATKFGSVGVSSYISAKGLNIVNDTSSYLATFQNTNGGEGDGIKIKLGRAKSSYTIPAAPTLESSTQFADLLNCNIPETQKLVTLGNIVKDDAIETAKTMAGIAVSAGNMIINVINDGLKLPLSIPDVTVPAIHLSNDIDVTGPINSKLKLPIVLPALTVPAVQFPKLAVPGFVVDVPVIPTFTLPGFTVKEAFELTPAIPLIGATTVMPTLPALTIPALDIPRTTLLTGREVMPKLPKIDLSSIGIPEIDIASLKFWGLDINICLDEKSSSPLNNSNEFIRFADKNDAQVGSIRGVSVANWASNYLNPVFFNKLRGAFLSSKADKFHAQYHFKTEITTALASYAKIGVEYSSGNGDYAEWLERADKMEFISAGDIVSVKAGKITKDLTNAEQVMVVSHAPIMLGNMPSAGKVDLGNSIVFIGQAPVKIMGPVASGDFIVGQINTPGYGIAKHQADMTLEDFKLAVGRSWDTDESEGIKLANTVIGIHNSSFLNLIKELKEKADNNDARLQAIEAKLNIAAPVKAKATITKNKK